MIHRREEYIQTGSLKEIFHAYEKLYGELSSLKHIIFRATQLADLEELAVLFSRQIRDRIIHTRNTVWLAQRNGEVIKVAADGAAVSPEDRQSLADGPASVMDTVIHRQCILWPPLSPEQQCLFTGFSAPTLFPLKNRPYALGFFAIDQVSEDKRELCQWFAQFASMMLDISNLHMEVKENHKELMEMTEILFTQQSRLAAIHHLGMEMMSLSDPQRLYRKMLETVAEEFGVENAALLILDGNDLYPNRLLFKDSPDSGRGIHFLQGEEEILKRCLASGRIISQKDFSGEMSFVPQHPANWRLFPLKGRRRTHGILLVNAPAVEEYDTIAIMLNQCGLALDNLINGL